jgi:hypothetical protein
MKRLLSFAAKTLIEPLAQAAYGSAHDSPAAKRKTPGP